MSLPLVIDTNVVLDLFVYEDPATVSLRAALEASSWNWLACAPMREELRRVLDYPHIARRLAARSLPASDVMAAFDRRARLHDVAPKAPVTCTDADDQKFIDLAVAHRAVLLSKDKAVLTMRKRLAALGVAVAPAFDKLSPDA
jgi:putative PIN family toxin of toxin-antitoxin system